MRKEKLALAGILIMSIFLIANISAEILISQPNAIYNLGDELAIEITLDSIKTGYLDINLNCNNLLENIYHNVPDSLNIVLRRTLTPIYVGASSGSCFITADYGGETKKSQVFEISKEVIISLESNNMSYFAGEFFSVSGNIIKKNNQNAQGFVDIKIDNANAQVSVESINGHFSANLNIPTNIKAGNYVLSATFYDKDKEGNILNTGKLLDSLEVKQKPARLEIALDKQEISTLETLKIMPFLYDFAGEQYASQVLISIKDSQEKSIVEKYIDANKEAELQIREDYTPGKSKIIIQKGNMSISREFKVLEVRKISSQLINQTLIIKNSGNVPYNGIIEVQIGNETILKELNLAIGGEIKFEISAPDGIYEVIIKDDSGIYSQGSFSLTGNVISLREAGEKISSVFIHYPIVWVFIVIIIGLGIWIYYRKYQHEKKFHFTPFERSGKKYFNSEKKNGGVEIVNPQQVRQKIDSAMFDREIRRAEQMTALHGMNQQAGIIAIKVKSHLAGIAKDSLRKALEYAYKNKAVSSQSGDFIILIFSPLLTKNNKNEDIAIKSALDIDNYLREHNRKFRNDEINYGIGVNSGKIINKLAGSVLQFMAITRTIGLAKKIADIANREVFLSKDIHEKTMNSVKAEKVASGSLDLFAIKRIIDTEKSAKFINDFMKRN